MKRTTLMRTALIVLLFTTTALLPAANISVPVFELLTYGSLESGSLNLTTSGLVELLIEGGYKFGGNLSFEMESDDLESLAGPDGTDPKTLLFKSAGVTVRDLFSSPLELTYFTGRTDIFCSGKDFPVIFGSDPFASGFTGPLYFPTGIQYDGIHQVNGTGLRLSSGRLLPWLKLDLYLYQDAFLGSGFYSTELRYLMNFDRFKLEAFGGASFPVSTAGIYRGGVLLYYSMDIGGEFLAQFGVPRWDPADGDEPMSLDLFYFLFEPRVTFDYFSIILSFFKHPKYYNQRLTNETDAVDINVNFQFGDLNLAPVYGGLENKVSFSTLDTQKLDLKLSPYLSIVTAGIVWDFKLGARLFPFDFETMFEGYLGIRTSF